MQNDIVDTIIRRCIKIILLEMSCIAIISLDQFETDSILPDMTRSNMYFLLHSALDFFTLNFRHAGQEWTPS